MLLEQVKNVNFVDEELEAEYEEVLESFNAIMAQLNEDFGMGGMDGQRSMPSPGMADAGIKQKTFPEDDEVTSALENAVKQMVAVKKAMTILNKMSDSPSRTRNKSRVMGNLNRVRGSLQRIAKMMQSEDESVAQG